MVKRKKIFVITIFSLFLAAVVLVFVFQLFFWDLLGLNTDTLVEEKTIQSDLGDKFIIRFETINFPDLETRIEIMSSNEEKITYFVIHEEPYMSELITIANDSQIRCYQIYEQLIYKVDEKFEGIGINKIGELASTLPKEIEKCVKKVTYE